MASGRALNILQVVAPGGVGGLETVVLELSAGLQQAGHANRIIGLLDAPDESHLFVREARARGLAVDVLVGGARGYLGELLALRRLLQDERPAIVHTHGYRADVLGGGAARWVGIPWVTTMHGFTGGGRKNRGYEWMQVTASRWADAIVAVAAPIRARLIEHGLPPRRVHLLPNALPAQRAISRNEARTRLGISADRFLVGWVGRLSPEKAPGDFLEALALIPAGPWMASILGEGALRPTLEAQARRLGIGERLQWHGMVPNAAEVFPAFDAWVLSSHTEGTPMTLLEAMAAEVPAIVTTVGGIPDMVSGDEAWLIPPRRPDLLAAAIEAVMRNRPARESRVLAASRRVRERHATAPWLAGYESVYQGVAGEAFRRDTR